MEFVGIEKQLFEELVRKFEYFEHRVMEICNRENDRTLHKWMGDKLSKHEIDCFVSVEESRWEESDISPVASIGETEIYFAINPERPDIKEALDSAMRRIKDDNPFYTDDLYRRYLSAQSSSFLSKEEREWIQCKEADT